METFRGPDLSPNCVSCPCAKEGKPVRPIRGAGSLKSLAIVGEGPSTEELSQGWPFVGPSGKLLQQALNASSIDRHSIWITNAILCQRPNSDAALREAINCCRPRLQHELSLVAPSAILALGTSAAEALELPVKAIKQARGTYQQSSILETPVSVITAIHPAAILRGGGAGASSSAGKNKMNVDAQYVFLESDLDKAWQLANGNAELWSDDIELITDNSAVSCAKVFQLMHQAKLLAIDLEWDKDGTITWVGIGTKEKSFSIWLPTADDTLRAILRAMGQSPASKLFHNLQADVPKWEEQIGPLAGIFEDTMLMHHAAYPGAAHDLQNVASQFLYVPPWKADRKNEEKEASKKKTKAEARERKLSKSLLHNERNAAAAEQAADRKRNRLAAHEKRNQVAHLLSLLDKKG